LFYLFPIFSMNFKFFKLLSIYLVRFFSGYPSCEVSYLPLLSIYSVERISKTLRPYCWCSFQRGAKIRSFLKLPKVFLTFFFFFLPVWTPVRFAYHYKLLLQIVPVPAFRNTPPITFFELFRF